MPHSDLGKVIRRITELPLDHLAAVERLLDRLESSDSALECGDSSPLSSVLDCGDSSPLSLPRSASVSASQQQAARITAAPKSGNQLPHSKDWPHAPVHRISEHGTYIVTSGTLYKEHHFRGPERLDLLEGKLLSAAKEHGWHLEAWAVFSNHYHFVAHSHKGSSKLNQLIKSIHGEAACRLNELDGVEQRQVWHNYWDTRLTFEKSYLARLNYVHQNAVRHRLVAVANQYRWCSAAWFERTATPAQVKTIYRFKTDKIKIHDDYEPI